MISAAVKAQQYQEQLARGGAETQDPVKQAEQLRLMLDMMWASNALDIQQTVTRVCQLVRPRPPPRRACRPVALPARCAAHSACTRVSGLCVTRKQAVRAECRC